MMLGDLIEAYYDFRHQLTWERKKSTPSRGECEWLETCVEAAKQALNDYKPSGPSSSSSGSTSDRTPDREGGAT